MFVIIQFLAYCVVCLTSTLGFMPYIGWIAIVIALLPTVTATVENAPFSDVTFKVFAE